MSTKDVVVDFYTREANAVHDALDNIGIVRTANGEKLTLSQRAVLLAREWEKLVAAVARIHLDQQAKAAKCGPH